MPENHYQPSEASVPASAPASSTTTPEATESELQPAIATDTERSGYLQQAQAEEEEDSEPPTPPPEYYEENWEGLLHKWREGSKLWLRSA
jgi:hypothetical protein